MAYLIIHSDGERYGVLCEVFGPTWTTSLEFATVFATYDEMRLALTTIRNRENDENAYYDWDYTSANERIVDPLAPARTY